MRLLSALIAVLALEILVCLYPSDQPDLINQGQTPQLNALPQQAVYQGAYHVHAKLTAYEPHTPACVGRWAFVPGPHKTATMTNAEVPGLGADFAVFPKGTHVTFHGLPLCNFIALRKDIDTTRESCTLIVDDTGSGSRQQTRLGIAHFDIRISGRGETVAQAYQRAKAFAMRWADVEVSPPTE